MASVLAALTVLSGTVRRMSAAESIEIVTHRRGAGDGGEHVRFHLVPHLVPDPGWEQEVDPWTVLSGPGMP